MALLSKVFEKCISSRLTSFLRKFNLLSKKQFGFQKGLSTVDALIEFSEFNYNVLNNRNHVINILVDFTKAFDTVNHDILLGKMHRYGIRGVVLGLFRSYLSQCVKIGPCVSSVADLPVGVAQGSVLGPLLFLLYINDLPSAIEDASVTLFADDASVCLGDSSLDNLIHKTNLTMACLSDWTIANKISINATKTEALIITNRPVDLSNVNISLCGELLQVADEVTYLGFKIDKNLRFDAHAKYVYSKVAKTSGILFKLRSYLNTDNMISLYYSLVYPYFSLAGTLCGRALTLDTQSALFEFRKE